MHDRECVPDTQITHEAVTGYRVQPTPIITGAAAATGKVGLYNIDFYTGVCIVYIHR